MSIYTITFIVDIEDDDEESATERARQMISDPDFEPFSVEVDDE